MKPKNFPVSGNTSYYSFLNLTVNVEKSFNNIKINSHLTRWLTYWIVLIDAK